MSHNCKHHHNADHVCGCGHDHDHAHDHGCGCGHDHSAHHHHDHGDNHGSCCGGCGGCGAAQAPREPHALSGEHKEFLTELAANGPLPVTRFVAESSKNDDVSFVMLAPVHLLTAADDMKTAKQTAAFLYELEENGLISLDYGNALEGYPYLEYEQSALYAYFCDTVREAAQKSEDFLADTPVLERGSLRITDHGTRCLPLS